jgi:hypothetical protein
MTLLLSVSGQHDLRVRSMGGPRPVDHVESTMTVSTDQTRPIKAETACDQEELAQITPNHDTT